MDPHNFSAEINQSAADLVSKLLNYPDLTRYRVQDLLNVFNLFLNNNGIVTLLNQMIYRLEHLGENPHNIIAYKHMVSMLKDPFKQFKSKEQSLDFFKNSGTYIPPIEVSVGVKETYIHQKSIVTLTKKNITIQFIPLRTVLKKYFEQPYVLNETLTYLNYLESNTVLISNVIQGEAWQMKKAKFGQKIVFPIFLYEDEYETNNPLGSHKGLGKNGTFYVTLPCLPPHLRSKTENIFLSTLFRTKDLQHVSLKTILVKTVGELKFLEETGIEIQHESGSTRIYFSLMGVIGDNLAVHQVLGFIGSFSANHPCRFCLLDRKNMNNVLSEGQCHIRTNSNYEDGLKRDNPSETGIAGPSALSDLKSISTIELLTVDYMHDILEGVAQYDLGLILYNFIVDEKLFILSDLNNRINGFYYGEDEIRNKPIEIKHGQINHKYIKMSAAKTLCLHQNFGVLIGDWIPSDNRYWKLVILFKDILDIVLSPVVHKNWCDLLEILVQEYLALRVQLFPDQSLKSKHHFLLHYARVIRLLGPLCNMSTMRCEHKNQDAKVVANATTSRKNICKTLAVKHQLQFSYRLWCKVSISNGYKKGKSVLKVARNTPEFSFYSSFLPINPQDVINEISQITFKNRTITQNTILMFPTESNPQLLLVSTIIETYGKILYVICKDITNYTYCNDHYHAYNLHESALVRPSHTRCLTIQELEFCSISRITQNGNGKYIPKRWV